MTLFKNPFTAKLMTFLAVVSVLLSALTPAHAEEEIPRYQVEIIVFEQLSSKGWTEERWQPIETPVVIEKSTPANSYNISPLFIKPATSSLGQVERKMQRGYRILSHQSWTQLAYGSKNSPTVMLEGQNLKDSFIGTIKVYKTRFAHVQLDLQLDRLIPQQIRTEFADSMGISEYDLPANWSFELKESRKVDNGELNYFDHPQFGALVRIQAL